MSMMLCVLFGPTDQTRAEEDPGFHDLQKWEATVVDTRPGQKLL